MTSTLQIRLERHRLGNERAYLAAEVIQTRRKTDQAQQERWPAGSADLDIFLQVGKYHIFGTPIPSSNQNQEFAVLQHLITTLLTFPPSSLFVPCCTLSSEQSLLQ